MDIYEPYGRDLGGGGSWKRFFYLVVNGRESLDSQTEQSFIRSGVNSGQDYVFVFIDIATDKRLYADLIKREEGQKFYEQVEKDAPLFLITDKPVEQIKDVKQIEVCPIRNYEKDVSVLYDKMGLHLPDTRKRFLKFLHKVNQYAHLKPNIAGLGLNLNEILGDWIKRLERNQP